MFNVIVMIIIMTLKLFYCCFVYYLKFVQYLSYNLKKPTSQVRMSINMIT